jgi:hypothetical protein
MAHHRYAEYVLIGGQKLNNGATLAVSKELSA